MSGQSRQIIEGVLLVFAALLPIVNPFGGAPVFLALTADCTPELRKRLATRVAVNAFLLLFGSVFVGSYVLDFFGLSVPIVQVAGGLIVCGLGWDLLRQGATVPAPSLAPDQGAAYIAARAFYPLTLPLTVDPGAISVAVTLGANHTHTIELALVATIAAIAGVLAIALTVWLAYRYADRVSRWLGHSRMMAVLRLSAFIVLCIGVQIAWNGVRGLIAELPK